MLCMHAMNPVDGVPSIRGRYDVIDHVNAANHQHIILRFDLPSNFSRQMFIACVDFARLQRTSESPGKSTTSRSDDVVKCRRVRLDDFRVDTIVFSNWTVHAESDGLR